MQSPRKTFTEVKAGAPGAGRACAPTADKVAYLRGLGPPEGPMTVRETHMSWVFIGTERVLKLKKPVRYPYLDFSTLEARETCCREEVRLNRRLAPDVYLGVRALRRDAGGRLTLDGTGEGGGEVVDWLVEMRRLPEDSMLNAAIPAGRVPVGKVDAIGALLAGFYAAADRPTVDPAEHLGRMWEQLAQDRVILTARNFMLDHGRDIHLTNRIETLLDQHAETLRARIKAGVIVEGHGDLRPQHICLTDPPVIIDCLEFNRSLRLVDPYDELAYLDLECRRLGADWIGPRLVRIVADRIGHQPSPDLTAFYFASRALRRARLALVHLLEPDPREPEVWQPLARTYLDLAQGALEAPGASAGRREDR